MTEGSICQCGYPIHISSILYHHVGICLITYYKQGPPYTQYGPKLLTVLVSYSMTYIANGTTRPPVHERIPLLREPLHLPSILDAPFPRQRLDDVPHARLPQEAEHRDVEQQEEQVFGSLGVADLAVEGFAGREGIGDEEERVERVLLAGRGKGPEDGPG